MFPFCLIIPFLHISSCSRLVYCRIIMGGAGLQWFKFKIFLFQVLENCFFVCSQGILGDSPSWFVCSWHVCARYLAVWVSKWSLNRKQCCAVLSKMWPEVCALLSRWRCPRLTDCYHSWRRWAAHAATSCLTPQPQSALLGLLTRDRRVSLCLLTSVLFSIRSIVMVWVLQVILWTD